MPPRWSVMSAGLLASGNSPFGVEKELCLELAPGHQLLWSDEEGHQKISPLWLRKERN